MTTQPDSKWKFSHTVKEVVEPYSTLQILQPIEYAYWINEETLEVKKVKVQS